MLGSVTSPRSRASSTSATRWTSAALSGSTVSAKRPLASVYSCAAIDARLAGERGEALKGVVHLRGVALEQPAAAHREQGVAGERDLLGGEMEGDMAGGVGGDVDQLRLDRADPRRIAAGDDPVHLRHPLGLGRAGDGTAGGTPDRVVAAGMVGVPVGVPDLGDAPAARCCGFQHRLGDRGIDSDRLARGGIVDQPDIIVAKDGDGDDFEHEAQLGA